MLEAAWASSAAAFRARAAEDAQVAHAREVRRAERSDAFEAAVAAPMPRPGRATPPRSMTQLLPSVQLRHFGCGWPPGGPIGLVIETQPHSVFRCIERCISSWTVTRSLGSPFRKRQRRAADLRSPCAAAVKALSRRSSLSWRDLFAYAEQELFIGLRKARECGEVELSLLSECTDFFVRVPKWLHWQVWLMCCSPQLQQS